MNPLFNDSSLPEWLDLQSDEIYDTLNFGLVKMNYSGMITAYNVVLSELAGVSKEKALGKNFFIEIAPCTNNFMVAEKYKKDILDEVIQYMFTYITKPTPVELRLIKGKNGSQYLLAKNA
jgi:photoactive yellow protein